MEQSLPIIAMFLAKDLLILPSICSPLEAGPGLTIIVLIIVKHVERKEGSGNKT